MTRQQVPVRTSAERADPPRAGRDSGMTGRQRTTPAAPPGPSWLSGHVVLSDGRHVFVRPVLPTDVDELRRAVAEADAETIHRRFLGGRPPRTDQELARLVDVDYDRRLAVVALAPDGRGVGIARYDADNGADVADVAVAVDAAWRDVGLATALIRLLAAGAASNGIRRLSADFLEDNQDVSDLFSDAGLPYTTSAAVAGVVTAEVRLPTDVADLL